MIIAIDFDGTIARVDASYNILGEMPGAIDALHQLARKHTLILWTCRGGASPDYMGENLFLTKALEWLCEEGFEFTFLNENVHPLGANLDHFPRKVFAHVYIDDRNLGGFPGWDQVLEELF